VPGRGTTFYFTLPALSTHADAPPRSTPNGAGAITGPLGDGVAQAEPMPTRTTSGGT